MKSLKIFSQWKAQARLANNNSITKNMQQIFFMFAIAALVWLAGPSLSILGYKPFSSPIIRGYVIISLFLIWILKFLLIEHTKKLRGAPATKLEFLEHRFHDALAFLKKTTLTRHAQPFYLYDLPWYLLIGPPQAGKTTLLAKADIPFILQKQNNLLAAGAASDHCDWWVTSEASLIDIPSKYCIFTRLGEKIIPRSELYRHFLNLSKQERGQQPIQGILICLPLPEIITGSDQKAYARLLHTIFQLLHETKKILAEQIAITLIITKCDLLTGFKEFFNEPAQEEIAQAWGIQIPPLTQRRIQDEVANRFNHLIRKLNQQLLWRIHHERNLHLRPYIKEFPLQIERLKVLLIDFVRKYSPFQKQFPIQGIYLTSALQPDLAISSQNKGALNQELQLLNQPPPSSKPYFIKQLLLQGLKNQPTPKKGIAQASHFLFNLATYSSAAVIISIIGFYLTKDFEQGLKKIYQVKNNLTQYQIAVHNTQNPEQQLLHATQLLNLLKNQATTTTHHTFKSNHLLKFYSHKSQLNVNSAYQKSLAYLLLPNIRNLLAEHLKQPLNQAPELVYGILKAYLILGDNTNFKENQFVLTVVNSLALKSFSKSERLELNQHLNMALTYPRQALALDQALIKKTRTYLTALPTLQLALLILKNNEMAAGETALNFNSSQDSLVFAWPRSTLNLPNIYNQKYFNTLQQNIPRFVQEAINGNGVLGINQNANSDPTLLANISKDLRQAYIQDYVGYWESLLNNLQLANIEDLKGLDNLITHITGKDSPFLNILQIIHRNTYFDPIKSASPRLQNLSVLIANARTNNNLLYQIFSSLKLLHLYLQPIMQAADNKKIAFNLVSARMKQTSNNDAITQLRLIANQSPEPINLWLIKISDESWDLLMKDASQYIDISWQKVMQVYQDTLANRFPFNSKAKVEVNLKDFTDFFGHPGIVTNYYNNFLQSFIDTTNDNWHWKILDNRQIFLSEEKLRQLQYAIKIHRTFFPNNDNKLSLQFSLQPYQFSKEIKSIKLKIDDKELTNQPVATQHLQTFTWPTTTNKLSLHVNVANKSEAKEYVGEWGLFKLINQYFETAVSNKQMVINFASNNKDAKYLLITQGQYNPFMSFNLNHFSLPQHLN